MNVRSPLRLYLMLYEKQEHVRKKLVLFMQFLKFCGFGSFFPYILSPKIVIMFVI